MSSLVNTASAAVATGSTVPSISSTMAKEVLDGERRDNSTSCNDTNQQQQQQQKSMKFLSVMQERALEALMTTSDHVVLYGPGGCGKSWTVEQYLSTLEDRDNQVVYCSRQKQLQSRKCQDRVVVYRGPVNADTMYKYFDAADGARVIIDTNEPVTETRLVDKNVSYFNLTTRHA